MTLIGYMRVSTDDQDLTLQRTALVAAGVAPGDIYMDEGISGYSRKRPGLNEALARLHAGDTLVVWKLDRLGRGMLHLIEMVEGFVSRGVAFRSLTEEWDTSSPMGKAMFRIGCVFAELERDMIRMRVKAGMASRMAAGVRMGRPVVAFYDRGSAISDIVDGMSLEEACRVHGFSMSTARRLKRGAGRAMRPAHISAANQTTAASTGAMQKTHSSDMGTP